MEMKPIIDEDEIWGEQANPVPWIIEELVLAVVYGLILAGLYLYIKHGNF